MYYPSLKEARELAASGGCRYVPVSRELFSDFITPIQALRILRAKSGHCFLLESAADSAGWGRYTFLGFDPTLEVTCKDGILQLRDRDTVRTELQHPTPSSANSWRSTRAPACRDCRPSPAGWWGTSPTTT